jgi:hypothetical protein
MKRELEIIDIITRKNLLKESTLLPIRQFLESLISGGKIGQNLEELLVGSSGKKILRRKSLANLSEFELSQILKDLDWKKMAYTLYNNDIIPNTAKINAFDDIIKKLNNRTIPSFSDFIEKRKNVDTISRLYNKALGKPGNSIVPDFIKKLQKEFNEVYFEEFDRYFEKNHKEMFDKLVGKKLTQKEIELLTYQLKGKYKLGSLRRVWGLAKKSADEAYTEIEKINTGYINDVASNPISATASKEYALRIQELMNNITLKTKRSISQSYWDTIKNGLSPDIRKSLDEMTPEQRWPYLVDSIPQSEKEQTLKDVVEYVTKFRTKLLNQVQKILSENIGKIVRFILIGSTSRYKDMYKLLAQYGRRKGAFKIYWSLIKWKILVPVFGNTIYVLVGPPFKKSQTEFCNNIADWLGIEGFRYDPNEYQSENVAYNIAINWVNELIRNPEFVAKEGNALSHFFELEYSDLLPYISNLISTIAIWYNKNYSKSVTPIQPTENDLPNRNDSAVTNFQDTIPRVITPIQDTEVTPTRDTTTTIIPNF